MVMAQPRTGPAGHWDRFVGPGMTTAETCLVLGTTGLGALLVTLRLTALGMSWPLVFLGALIAADVIGGAVCNMTATTKRWYHRPGQTARDHAGFISLHLAHIGAVAWAFRGPAFYMLYAAVIGGWLLISALAVLRAPLALRSALGALTFILALGLSLYALGPTPGLEWFVPLLFLKLLIWHAIRPAGTRG